MYKANNQSVSRTGLFREQGWFAACKAISVMITLTWAISSRIHPAGFPDRTTPARSIGGALV